MRCPKQAHHCFYFGLYDGDSQLGFTQLVTDYATFGWLCDVFVLPSPCRRGLGKWLVKCVVNHPDVKNIRRLLLRSREAHGLYAKYAGFLILLPPETWVERLNK